MTKYRRGLNDPAGLVAGDVNGDRKSDLVTGDSGAGGFQVLLGRGAGRFGRVVRSGPRNDDARHTVHAISDLNGDRDLDLIAAERSEFDIDDDGPQHLVVAFGDGNGRFRQRRLPLHDGARAVVDARTADLDRDGRLDVLALDRLDSFETRLTVLLGTGAGEFRPPQAHALDEQLALGSISANNSMQVIDVDRDRRVDVVVDDRVLLNDGLGGFRHHPIDSSLGFALGDLNLDGPPDLVTGRGPSPLRTALGVGDGTFRPAALTTGGGVPHLVAELSGDGRPDVLASDGLTAALYRGNGRGQLAAAAKLRRANGILVDVVIARSQRPADKRIIRLYGDVGDVHGAGTVLARRVPLR